MTKEETEIVCNNTDISSLETDNLLHNVDHSTFIADHLLDILTDNEHRRTSNYIEEEKKLKEMEEKLLGVASSKAQEAEAESSITAEEPKVDFDSLKSLSDIGIDVSFLESLQKNYEDAPPDTNVDNLSDTASLLNELKDIQLERLSAILPAHFSQILLPNDHEMALASQIQTNLVEMTQNVRPGDVVPEEALRRMLGISFDGQEHLKNIVKVVNKTVEEVRVVQDSADQNPDQIPEMVGEIEIAAAADQSNDVQMIIG